MRLVFLQKTLEWNRLFKHFKQVVHRRWQQMKYNNIVCQRILWRRELAKYDWKSDQLFGYDWGDPENPHDRFGNYLEVKNRLLNCFTKENVVLEIGSLGGKWTQYLLEAKSIICVDINDLGFEYIRRKLSHPSLRFYLTKGDELNGITDNSVDLIFSMDCLVRVPKRYLSRYFIEMCRVLKPGGHVFLHLPSMTRPESSRRAFVDLSLDEIHRFCNQNGFKKVSIDEEVISHGVILEAVKA